MKQGELNFTKEELDTVWDRVTLRHVKSNNWLKMHGYPMRRKPRGSRKKPKPSVYIDEVNLLMKKEETQTFLQSLYNRARKSNRN